MYMRMQLVDEDNEIEKSSDLIEKNIINTIVQLAKQLNFDCLSFIDPVQDTYFNDKQCVQITKELLTLKQYPEVDKLFVILLEQYMHAVLSAGYLYLRFRNET